MLDFVEMIMVLRTEQVTHGLILIDLLTTLAFLVYALLGHSFAVELIFLLFNLRVV